ncbi:hypothetical protein ACX9I7_29605 [Streptomyces sp. L500]
MDPYVRTAGLDEAHLALLNDALSLVRSADVRAVVRGLMPRLTEEEQESLATHCDVAHAASTSPWTARGTTTSPLSTSPPSR